MVRIPRSPPGRSQSPSAIDHGPSGVAGFFHVLYEMHTYDLPKLSRFKRGTFVLVGRYFRAIGGSPTGQYPFFVVK